MFASRSISNIEFHRLSLIIELDYVKKGSETMVYKSRTKSKELAILEILNDRMQLARKDKQHYFNLKKGYEGEVIFDSLTEKLQCECLILNDLLFEVNHTIFQLDSLIIVQGKILFFEVKNFEGDYYYESDKLYKKPKLEIINPLLQLSRSEPLLRQLLLNHGFNLPIDASVVFINPKFTLYQAPLYKPFIFPTQIKNYLADLNATPSKLTPQNKELADMLLSLHITESPYEKLPSYHYDQLQKGISCTRCHSFSITVSNKYCFCMKCQYQELLDEAVLRNIKEFRLLFPNKKLTTRTIHHWSQVVPERRIRNILLRTFTKMGDHRWSYFE